MMVASHDVPRSSAKSTAVADEQSAESRRAPASVRDCRRSIGRVSLTSTIAVAIRALAASFPRCRQKSERQAQRSRRCSLREEKARDSQQRVVYTAHPNLGINTIMSAQ